MPYSATQAQSPVLTTLYRFTDQNGDGAGPTAGVVVAKSGLLYGTTATGGSSNYGTVFELKPPVSPSKVWTETVLYSFGGPPSDGSSPNAVMIGENGTLYGTTAGGGSAGNGTVFQLTPPASPAGAWTESVLHSFTGQNGDGLFPVGAVVLDQSGALYGATYRGGLSDVGTIYQLTPADGAWAETVLHSFTGQSGDGAYPEGGCSSARRESYMEQPIAVGFPTATVVFLVAALPSS